MYGCLWSPHFNDCHLPRPGRSLDRFQSESGLAFQSSVFPRVALYDAAVCDERLLRVLVRDHLSRIGASFGIGSYERARILLRKFQSIVFTKVDGHVATASHPYVVTLLDFAR